MIYKDNQAATVTKTISIYPVEMLLGTKERYFTCAFGCNGPEKNHGEQKRLMLTRQVS